MDKVDKLKELKEKNDLEIMQINYICDMIKNIISNDQSFDKNIQLYEIVYNNIKKK